MTVSITIEGANFTKFVDSVNPPNSNSAAYIGLFGTDDANALNNLVTGVAGTKIGTISHGANHTTMSRDWGIDTGVAMTSPVTFYAVCTRVPISGGGGQGLMGTFNNGDAAHRKVLLVDPRVTGNPTAANAMFVDYVNGQRYAPVSPGMGASDYNFAFAQYDGTTMKVGYGYTSGGDLLLASSSGPYSYSPASKNLRIGANGYGSLNTLFIDYAAAAAWASVLTNDQLLEEYAYHKARMARLGLTLN